MTQEIDRTIYQGIREILVQARKKAYSSINEAMVLAYWEIGKQITEAQGDRAEYGKQLMHHLSKNLTTEFGKGFTERNLRQMHQFYLTFPKWHTLCAELSWSHYRILTRIKNAERRNFYMNEAASESWSVKQLERQANSFYHERLLATQDSGKIEVAQEIQRLVPKTKADKSEAVAKYSVLADKENLFASKYMLYLPTEEELVHAIEGEFEALSDSFSTDNLFEPNKEP